MQEFLSLPPINLAIRNNYSEPAPRPPDLWRDDLWPDDRPPDTCDPSNPRQALLTFPWTATFTLYTCSSAA